MEAAKRRAATLLLCTAGVVLLLDRLTKTWAASRLPGRPIDLLGRVLTFRYETNSGGAFGLGQSASWVFATASLAVALAILLTAFRHTSAVTAVALGLILGGSVGNLVDRLVGGSGVVGGRVVDFIDLHWWPVFNLADSAIVIGALILGFSSWRIRQPAGDTETSGGPPDLDPKGPHA